MTSAHSLFLLMMHPKLGWFTFVIVSPPILQNNWMVLMTLEDYIQMSKIFSRICRMLSLRLTSISTFSMKVRLQRLKDSRTKTLFQVLSCLLRLLTLSDGKMRLGDIRKIIQRKRTTELPGHIPKAVHPYLIRFSVSQWEIICLDSFELIRDRLQTIVEQWCQAKFDGFRTSGLEAAVRYPVSLATIYLIEKILWKF
jgi:hypothetical protein